MNWNKIKEDNAKAWKLLKEWNEYARYFLPNVRLSFLSAIQMNETDTTKNNRFLFDFFDTKGIYIEIEYNDEKQDGKEKLTWHYYINGSYYYNILQTRSEAEISAFTIAFKILEQNSN